ncbi:PAS domain-containing sensor histidine kinase [Pseudoxanthomonas indica]|uniref:histidine kinase n=1 Tax=Pseudoxanthomonas indica TaxID=428993 RepID=A0A1T5JEN9_9GAMM|nr:PAS domain-containing sensor histidine kinase [Pseudoxanthomonas indica]GGD58199.1 hypothetical protein GCM10007235_33160 [Pseudoxanthomonas indica]SKC49786.1 His Kinase A (phospho-acceptor) domain-containing protein [Pseudoxanthomonas indica]
MPSTPPSIDEKEVQQMLWQFVQRTQDYVVLLLDSAGTITWANEGAGVVLGASADELRGMNFSHFFTEADIKNGIPDHELEVALTSGSASDDRWMERMDHSRFWASGMAVYLGGDCEGCAYLKLFRDLTVVRMQLETDRKRRRSAVQAADNMSGAIAVLAHELRNPLAGIALATDLLDSRIPEEVDVARPMSGLNENLKLASRLIDDLLQHSRITAARFRLDRSPCTLRDLLTSSAQIAQRQVGQENRNVHVLVPKAEIEMHIDGMRMQQVFVNLIANALRYTPNPGRIWVTGTVEGLEVVTRVTDEGRGIAPEQLSHLFDLFTDSRVKGTKLGLGLGLAVVKKTVELHGGSVQAKSEGRGKGSQFVVRFPAHE